MKKQVVIIGNGISGITLARNIRKMSEHDITVISSESDHFFSRTALMYIYMGHMKYEHTKPYEDWFWDKNRITLMRNHVERVVAEEKKLYFSDGGSIPWDILVIASGSKPNKFGWPGQDLKGVSGMYSLQDLATIEQYTKNIERGVIVGGGLIGIEMAEMLHSRNIPVTFLVREDSFWNNVLPAEESDLINRHIRQNHIDLRLGSELKSIEADANGRVKSVITNTGEEIVCQFVGLTAGVSPNIDFLKDSGIETARGVLVNDFLETNISGIYAIGDCAQHQNPPGERRPVEQVWYTGRMQGETLAYTLCGQALKYQPGIWFNSAKFFDLEYQTYGWVWAKSRTNEKAFYWENEKGTRALKLVYDRSSNALLGMNAFGLRIRHETAENWIRQKTPVDEVLNHFGEADFDPEFYKSYQTQIKEKFLQQTY